MENNKSSASRLPFSDSKTTSKTTREATTCLTWALKGACHSECDRHASHVTYRSSRHVFSPYVIHETPSGGSCLLCLIAGPRVGSEVGKHAHACRQELSSGNPELETKPGFRMSLMKPAVASACVHARWDGQGGQQPDTPSTQSCIG